MNQLSKRQFLPWWLLLISLAFNIGFGSTYSIRSYRAAGTTPTPDPANSTPAQGLGGGTMSMVFAHESLRLSPAQQSQIQTINENLLSEINHKRMQLRTARRTLAEILSQSELSTEDVATQLDHLNTLQRAAQQLVIEHLLMEKAVLLPEQLEPFNDLIRQRVCPGDGTGGFGPGSGRGAGDGSGIGRRDGSGRGIQASAGSSAHALRG